MKNFKGFITGNPGSGKTTLLKDIAKFLKDHDIHFSGFITEEVRIKGVRTGFNIENLKTSEKKMFASTEFAAPCKFGKYFLNLENFESIALDCFEGSDIILIDEIGKMEFYSEKFKKLLFDNINKDVTIIGTLHRDYVELFKSYGKIYFLTREKYDDIKREILNNVLC